MRLHTDGSNVVLLTPAVRLTWRSSGRHTQEEVPSNGDVTDYDRSGLLCLTPRTQSDYSARLAAAGAVAADALSEEEVAAVIIGEDGTFLVRGPVNMEGDWPSVIDIGALSPTRVSWPAGLIWKKGDKTMYDMAKDHGDGIPETIVPTLACNAFGTAVASCGSGTIVVVRPDSRLPDFSVQVPSQEEASIYALPTEEGVLVTIVVDGQDSAYVHIAEDGKILGHRAALSATPALTLDAGFLLYDDSKSALELVNSKLETLATLKCPLSAIEAASAADGASFAICDAETLLRGHVDAKGELVIVETIEFGKTAGKKRPGEQAAIDAGWDPEKVHGKPAVGFAAGVTPSPWTASAGQSFELIMHARSSGGPGKGIAIVIGGDAIKHCEFDAAEVDGLRKALQKDAKGNYSAEFPTIDLLEGLAIPLSPKPKNDAQKHAAALYLAETHLELKLVGKATKASGELMSVSISALKSDSPPLKWMRPLTIS